MNAIDIACPTCKVAAGEDCEWGVTHSAGSFHAPRHNKANKEAPMTTATTKEPKVAKPLPDLSGFSAIKQVALLRCWTGAAKTPESKARFAPALAIAEAELAEELKAQAAMKAQKLADREAERKDKAAAEAKAKADRKATKAADAKLQEVAPAILPPTETQAEAEPKAKRTPPAPPKEPVKRVRTKESVKAELVAILK